MDLNPVRKDPVSEKNQLKAFEAQNRLLEILLELTRTSASDQKPLKIMIKEALKVATKISGADNGSLFLLDENGVVTDSLLARKEKDAQRKKEVIGSVLEKGLAGWVKQNLTIGHVVDTQKDARWLSFSDQPYQVGSALAIPILRHDFLFGILTLSHPDRNYFGEEAINLVRMTADQMAVAIENAQLYERLEEAYQSIRKAKETIEAYSRALLVELKKGQNMQKSFLPAHIPQMTGCSIEAYFHPALQLSGDFYDVFLLPGNRLGIVIADVSDKGVGSALFMALSRSLVRIFSGHFHWHHSMGNTDMQKVSAETILSAVSLTNEYIEHEHSDEGMFVTLFFGVFAPLTGELVYINCGHEPLMIVNKTGIKTRLRPTGPAIGIIQGASYKTVSIRLEPGDILLGVTDGVTEACSPANELYTRKRLETAVTASSSKSAHAFVADIRKDLSGFIQEAPQADDITILVVQKD